MAKRVLAFGCHPDDVEGFCAGTLALLARKGWEVHIAVMASGEMGSTHLPPQAIRAQRAKEAEAAAELLGARLYWAGVRDIEVAYTAEYRRRVVQIVRGVNPDLVFTHPPTDYLIDHEETSRLVRNAVFVAPIPNYDDGTPSKPTSRIPHLYYMNAAGRRDIFGRPLPLSCAVNILSVLEFKTKMLACHASQRAWLRYINGWDEYLDNLRRLAEEEGRAAGLQAAEGFIQHRGLGHPQDNLLREILGGLCIDLDPQAGAKE